MNSEVINSRAEQICTNGADLFGNRPGIPLDKPFKGAVQMGCRDGPGF
ncbi:MAG: hypothetical protein LUC43_08750 [Burkholderiales bacterium]|nr:hypothetical protein [Burkholderiales bacterium]